MKVYSLKAKQGEPRYLAMVQANHWFWQRGYQVEPFDREQLEAGELDTDLLEDIENTIVYGSVAIVRDAVRRANRPAPPNLDFPVELKPFLGRQISETTMREVRRWEHFQPERLPVHIKPRDHHKLFNGKVVSAYRDLIGLASVPSEEPLIVQEIVQFVSEWRASILRGRVLNIAHYKGQAMRFPNPAVILEAIEHFTQAPIGYAMDWGVTSDGRTLLVEVNDGFALGNYGVPGYLYTALIECRWRELMGLDDSGVGL